MRGSLTTALVAALIVAPSTAGAISGFRITGAKPRPYGADLELAYNNTWPTAEKTTQEKDVRLFVHTALPGAGVESGPTVKEVGIVAMPGDGEVKVQLDYSKLGLKPGQQIWLHGRWVSSNHGWGEPWSAHSRSAGTHTLPDPSKNSLLRRPALLQRPTLPRFVRWPLRGRPAAPRSRFALPR